MDVQFEQRKVITSVNARSGKSGYYAVDNGYFRLDSCRERFAKMWTNKIKSIFFQHEPDGGRNVASFIIKTEDILQRKKHSQFALTNWSDILWIEPQWFWRACRMRKSLFTILLRCGRHYDADEDNYEAALFKEPYITRTGNAVKRFLFGYTKYIGTPPGGNGYDLESRGWSYLLGEKDRISVKSMLVAPRKQKERSDILKDELWA